ncbi:hypothetical protein DYB32_004604, partial [Aphanomyces invadans]
KAKSAKKSTKKTKRAGKVLDCSRSRDDGAPTKKRTTKKKVAAAKKAVTDEAETESENEDLFEEAARKAEARWTDPSPRKQSVAKKKAATTTPAAAALPENIQTRLKQIVTEGDVETLTLKTVMDTLTTELNADVKTHKNAIKDFIANCL